MSSVEKFSNDHPSRLGSKVSRMPMVFPSQYRRVDGADGSDRLPSRSIVCTQYK